MHLEALCKILLDPARRSARCVIGVLLLVSIGGCSSEPPIATDCPPSAVICESYDDDDTGKADDSTVRRDWGDSIVIVGRPGPVALVIEDLETMKADPIGASILIELEAAAAASAPTDGSDRRLVLRARDELDPSPFDCARTMFREGWLVRSLPVGWRMDAGRVVVTEPGELVPPGAIRVLYNRNCSQTYEDGSPCFTPWFLLAHELLHASHGMRGTVLADHPDNSDPMPGGSIHEEAITIGRGAYVGLSPSENAIRREHDQFERDSHGQLCGPRGEH